LTIPLQITLSDIKLSAFIILVFSRQKGLTLVFRNDPLESLKVSSTFDSIPFVRDYLQKTIEQQLRVLMMDELPAIIHRLSLRLWCPDHRPKEEEISVETDEKEVLMDPFASPPQDAVDAHGNLVDAEEISTLSLEGRSETHSLFSQKNLLRLAALNDSQRTLSLFTPSIREAVFRAWAGPSERGDSTSPSSGTPALTRTHSYHSSSGTHTYTFNDHAHSSEAGGLPTRPSLMSTYSTNSVTTGLSLGSGRHARSHGRKKKTRVINLRKSKNSDDVMSESEGGADSATVTDTDSVLGGSEPIFASNTKMRDEEPEDHLVTPPRSPNANTRVRFGTRVDSIDPGDTPRPILRHTPATVRRAEPLARERETKLQSAEALLSAFDISLPAQASEETKVTNAQQQQQQHEKRPTLHRAPSSWTFNPTPTSMAEKSVPLHYDAQTVSSSQAESSSSAILQEAWMMKMANELARRAQLQQHEKEKVLGAMRGSWAEGLGEREREETPPPAYAQ
jgi:distribution and morphology protein 34